MEAPRAEFLVQKDRSVAITFYDDALEPVAAVDQNAVIWANAKSGRVKLETEKKDGMLISRQPFPEGEGYNVVVQLKSKPEAKAQSFKITYHTEPSEKCKLAEYACTLPGRSRSRTRTQTRRERAQALGAAKEFAKSNE